MKGVLLIHTGVPKSIREADLKQFQEEIENDPLVINPKHGIPELSKYETSKKIISHYNEIRSNLLKKIKEETTIPVAIATRYGEPSIFKSLEALAEMGVTRLLVYPLFPQFARSTLWSAIIEAMKVQEKYFPEMTMERMVTFYNRPEYIDLLVAKIEAIIEKDRPGHIVFSYHGVPEFFSVNRDVTKNECSIEKDCCNRESHENLFCYQDQCHETTHIIAEELNLEPGTYSTVFHSRLGLEPWLFPSTEKMIKALAKKGIEKPAIICPGIVIPDIEYAHTIETAKSTFHESGGKELIVIPGLNDDNKWAKALAYWIDQWRIIDIETGIA